MPKKACCLRSRSVSGSFQAEIGKPGTQNPGPVQVFKLRFVPSRTQKNDVTMWRNRHICTKFQENRHTFGSAKNNFFKTWQRHIEPAMWCFVTKMWRHMFSSPSLTQTQVHVLGNFLARKDTQACRGCLVMLRGTRSGSRNPWSRHPRNGWACQHKTKTFGCAAWCSQWHPPRGLVLCDCTTNWSTTSFSVQFLWLFQIDIL